MMSKSLVPVPDQKQANAEQQHSRKDKDAHDGIVDFNEGLVYQWSDELVIAVLQFSCCAKANQRSLVKHGNLVGDSSRTPHIMGNDHKRRTILLLYFEEEVVDLRGGDPVESAARLVDQ